MSEITEDWVLLKKINGLNLEEKVFTVDKEQLASDEVKKMIPTFKKTLEDMGHEVFDVFGGQLVTSAGVYFIAHRSEVKDF